MAKTKNKKQVVVKKGYTITVVSWENDGDYYATKSKIVDSIEEAKAIYKLCTKVFCSCNNGKGGIGNMSDDNADQASEIILKFMKANPILYDPTGTLNETDEQIIDAGLNINYELLGSSGDYYSRVCESCEITYSPVDIEVDVITF